jgi:uncharacterized protein YdhG (YjbR/CyaY superfamily)
MASSTLKRTIAREGARVRTYFARQPLGGRRAVRKLREIIRSVAPRAVDAFSYRMPAVKLEGRILVWYAAFKHHCSLFPMTRAIRHAHAADLQGYEMSAGTIRFPLTKPLPVGLVKRLVKARVAELRAKARGRKRR